MLDEALRGHLLAVWQHASTRQPLLEAHEHAYAQLDLSPPFCLVSATLLFLSFFPFSEADYCDVVCDVDEEGIKAAPEEMVRLSTPAKPEQLADEGAQDIEADELPSPTSVLLHEPAPPKMRRNMPASYGAKKATYDATVREPMHFHAFNEFSPMLTHW